MNSKYKPGDIAYIVENGLAVREVKVIKANGDSLVLQFTDTGGGVRLRENRLYPDSGAAAAALPKNKAPGHWET